MSLLFVFLFLGCRFAGAGELCEINFDKIVFLSGWTKSGKVQFVKASEEILGKADQMLIDTLWRWQQTVYNNDTRSIPPAPGNYTLKLLPDGKINIRADCNLGGGVYPVRNNAPLSFESRYSGTRISNGVNTLRGNEISIKITHTTRAACPPESLEHSYIRDLNVAARYCMEGDFLYIDLKNDTGTMKFMR